MRIVIQRVKSAKVKVDKKVIGSIKKGIVVLLAIDKKDTKENADWLVNKLEKIRIFDDKKGKLNKNLLDVNGEILIVSQFTLLGDCNKGNRPSFDRAAGAFKARDLYTYFIEKMRKDDIKVSTGAFGKYMEVSLVNDGPVSFILEKV